MLRQRASDLARRPRRKDNGDLGRSSSRRPTKERAPWRGSLRSRTRNLNAGEIGWPFRLGLEGGIVDRSQDIGWQRTFGHGRQIVPEMLHRRGADDDAIVAFGV